MTTRHIVALGALLPAVLAGTSFAQQPTAGQTVVLAERDHWRKHYTFSRPVFAMEGGNQPANAGLVSDGIYTLFRAPPPAGWTAADFDDSSWLLRPGQDFAHGIRDARLTQQLAPDATSVHLRGSDPFFMPVGLVCQRSRFTVADRGKIRKLTLSLSYRGGFVAYLNGREVARGHLPAGAITPDTPGEVYPPEAFFQRDSLRAGKPRLLDVNDSRSDQWALRERSFGPAEIPLDVLRDGVNVLAVELHRASYPGQCAKPELFAAMVGLSLLELRAEGEPGAFGSSGAASQPRLAAVEVARTVFDPARSGGNESPGPVRIVAARNGLFAGQVVVWGEQGGPPLNGLSATVSPLVRAGGTETIGPQAVQISYGQANPFWPKALADLGAPVPTRWKLDAAVGGGTRFDILLDSAPADARAVAIWLSVRTPGDLPAGRYAGQLAIRLVGRDLGAVPVELDLADWTLPDVKDYATLINIYQSPETLAEYYKVKPWSEAHWKLIEKSMRLMGEIGNIGLFIPLLAESQMGNPESMVVWLRQPDGSYKYDFTVFDRYLDTALKSHDRLRFISLNVWGYEAALRTWRGPRDYATFHGARVTVADPATGARTSMKLPRYGTAECEAMWQPLLLALRDRLKGRGLDGKLLLGLCADMGPDQATAAMFHNILPGAGWIAESHQLNPGYVYDSQTKAAMPVRYNSIVYGAEIPDPSARRLYGWQHRKEVLVMNFNRSGSNILLFGYQPPWSFRSWMEATLACGRNGVGRVGGDYWHMSLPLLGEGNRDWGAIGGSGGTMFGRYMHSHSDESGLGRSCTDLFGPGPDGPVATVRLANAREGIQESEARAFIERALLDRGRTLPADLARRCQELLDERTNILRLYKFNAAPLGQQGWQDRARRLFDAAGEVASTRAKVPRAS